MTHSHCFTDLGFTNFGFKTFCFRKVSIALAAVALVSVVTGLFLSGAAVAATSIADSWHNLGSDRTTAPAGTPNGGATANQSTATAEVCVFCHTPHGGDNQFIVPLWNKPLDTTKTYITYASLGTSTFDAQETSIGSISVACLSCHDGTQAIDSVLNAPGSGGFNAAGDFMGGAGSTSMIGSDINTDGSGTLATGIVQNIGLDLSNDHPVSMQYGGGGFNTGALAGPPTDPDFNIPSNITVNNQVFWWIDAPAGSTGVTGARDRLDVILYTRTDAAIDNGLAQPFVECGSCHDPHNVENPTFLRISNGIVAGSGFTSGTNDSPSGLCLTCHNK